MNRKLAGLLFALLAFNLVFFSFTKDYLGTLLFPIPGTVEFFAAIASIIIFQFFVFDSGDRPTQRWVLAASTVAVLASGLALFRASVVDRMLLALLAAAATVLSYYASAAGRGIGGIAEVFAAPFLMFGNFFGSILESSNNLSELAKGLKLERANVSSERKQAVWPLVFGVVLAIPLILVLAMLLSNADPVFSKFWKELVDFDFDSLPWWLIGRAFHSAWFVVGAVAAAFLSVKKDFVPPLKEFKGGNLNLSLSVVVGAVAVLLASFLIIQFPYVFANVPETELTKFGVNTYSEYVTKGFVELSLVSAIVYGIALVALNVSQEATRKAKLLQNLNLLLLGEVLIFVISVLRRVYLYQIFHGLTRVRVYGTAFLLLGICLTIILILRHFTKQQKLYVVEIALVVFFVLGTSALGVDNLIATRIPPTVNNEIDYSYISRLSPDAYEGWIAGYKHAKSTVESMRAKGGEYTTEEGRQIVYASLTLSGIRNNYFYLISSYGSESERTEAQIMRKRRPIDVREYNLVEKSVYAQLKATIPFKELDELSREAGILHTLILQQGPVELDRSLNSPLHF